MSTRVVGLAAPSIFRTPAVPPPICPSHRSMLLSRVDAGPPKLKSVSVAGSPFALRSKTRYCALRMAFAGFSTIHPVGTVKERPSTPEGWAGGGVAAVGEGAREVDDPHPARTSAYAIVADLLIRHSTGKPGLGV